MLNRITIMGRLTHDPELRYTQNGTPVCSFSVACDRDYKDATGAKPVDFLDIVAWRNLAEFVSKYLTKGRMAVVDGRLQLRDWFDRDGNKRRSAEIVANSINFGDSKPKDQAPSFAAVGAYSGGDHGAEPPARMAICRSNQNMDRIQAGGYIASLPPFFASKIRYKEVLTMRFTRFTLTQDGHAIGEFTVMELAVGTATRHAADTGKPVTVVAHVDGGDSKEAIFNPDGTNDKIWNIDKGRPLVPAFGQVYFNRGDGEYRCLSRTPMTGTTYYNASGGSSNTVARFQNVESRWTLTAKGIIEYLDGTIEWDHSRDGHFEEVRGCPV